MLESIVDRCEFRLGVRIVTRKPGLTEYRVAFSLSFFSFFPSSLHEIKRACGSFRGEHREGAAVTIAC